MQMCSNCGFLGLATLKCYGCSNMVCKTCMPIVGKDCVECQFAFPVPAGNPQTYANADASEESTSNRITISLDDHMPLGVFRGTRAFAQNGQKLDTKKENTFTPALIGVVESCLQQMGVEQSQSDYVVQNVKKCLEQDDANFVVETTAGNSVPKRIKNKKASSEGRTMMICNIPCRVSHTDLVDAIASLGFVGIEFVHLPCRFGSDANLGYGFVHFSRRADADRFALAFKGYRFNQKGSAKECTVKVADRQGRNGSHRQLARHVRIAEGQSP